MKVLTGGHRYMEALALINALQAESHIRHPCYVCGEPNDVLCAGCHRPLCGPCWAGGGHNNSERLCPLVIPGRNPD
jgi:hypothetical protein